MNHLKKLQHLYWRAGFGLTAKELQRKEKSSIQREVEQLIKKGKKNQDMPNVAMPFKSKTEIKAMSKDERKKLRMKSRQAVADMNANWVKLMAKTNNPLLERMSLFWHDHFACRIVNPRLAVNYMKGIREHSLGNFRDLLMSVSKSAAMIRYLNNQQNVKKKPNENFARELMELFTIGRGNYTENDIKESARAFTGWSSNMKGEFVFRKFQHDTGKKTFMGITGNFGGEDIINIILSKKETAVYLTTKIYRYFVSQNINEKRINNLANYFYKNDYDIGKLMQKIFTSSWFYDDKIVGNKIKSPIDLLVGVMKTFDVEFKGKKAILFYEKALGQMLFNPPNVAGWTDGKAWIDNSTLMTRLNFVGVLFGQIEMSMKVKEDFEAKVRNKIVKRFVADVSADKLVRAFARHEKSKIYDVMNLALIQPTRTNFNQKFIEEYTVNNSNKSDYIKTLAFRLMSTPEYQMC
jgi:uncharacterized protein (DUF1800 family)